MDTRANDKAAQSKFMDTFFNIDDELPEEGDWASVDNKGTGLKNKNNQRPPQSRKNKLSMPTIKESQDI